MAMVIRSESSSSSSMPSSGPQTCFSYDVFLSFRGEDTRKSFTDHLYKALEQADIRTFRDDDAMDRGKLLKPELEKAIHQSAISLIVFSENYASSDWCLHEVMMIIKEQETSSSKHEVVPVFFKVDPSDVRNQRGSFGKAFDVHEDNIKAERDPQKKRMMMEEVVAWRSSLKKAATLAGIELTDGYESKFIDDIVNVIRKKLDYNALYIEDKIVGIKYHVYEIETWLQDPSPNAVALVLAGMGGIGKTTIAKCIYNSNIRRSNFDATCFLANISEMSKEPRGLVDLQIQLLSTILRSKEKESIWDVDRGTAKITKAIGSRKVFVILDDVTNLQQLQALLGPQRFYPGTKVIITTRHTWLVNHLKGHPKVHNVKELCPDDAIKLFSLYAFDQYQPIEPYIVQSELFVSYCMGLPLALRVLGSSVRGNADTAVWEDTMRKLGEIPNSEIENVLEVSYRTLADDKDKDLFLHIACFFEGKKEDYIVKILEKCGLYPVAGIRYLTERSLLSVEHGRVMMHQLIKKMGREVVRQESPRHPGNRSRLWDNEDSFNVLQDHTGTKEVQGLMLDMEKMKSKSTSSFPGETKNRNFTNFKFRGLENMRELMLLQLNYVTFSGKYKNLPKKLRLLRWHGFFLESIPSDDICLDKLVELDMSYSKLKHVWNDLQLIGSLKFLNLSYSADLIETPDFQGLPALERLILKGCSSLVKIHKSITNLRELILLDITDCRSLRDVPSLPMSLVDVEMSGCLNLGVVAGRLQCLDLPSSFSKFLGKANLSNCNLLDDHFCPYDWSSMISLRYLKIGGDNVTSFPKFIETIPRLHMLTVDECPELESIVGLPKCLHVLFIVYNKSLRKVQPPPKNIILTKMNCPRFCDLVGHHMVQSADKVERKIIKYLGLESSAGEGMELSLRGVKVLHEFGIFSTFISDEQITSSFTYREVGPEISFCVPSLPDGARISGFSMCAMLTDQNTHYRNLVTMEVYNKTKDVFWVYKNGSQLEIYKNVQKHAWLSVWRCGNLLEVGDEIVMSVEFLFGIVVEEYCINLIFEDDEEVDGERKEANNVGVLNQISWTDRMLEDISDYVNEGERHSFESSILIR